MKRVIILGPPGVGKTTLSREISRILGLVPLHLDSLYFEAGWVLREKSEAGEDIREFIERNDRWVMDGNWTHSLPMRIQAADTIIYLDYGLEVSREGVVKRYNELRGRERPDVPQCEDRLTEEFLEYIETFEERRGRTLKESILGTKSRIKSYIFSSREECGLFIEGLKK